MADWRRAAMSIFVAEGVRKLGPKIKALKRELMDKEDHLTLDEIRFLTELRMLLVKRAKAKKVTPDPAFDDVYFQLLYKEVLVDGAISREAAGMLREVVYTDGRVDNAERTFLQRLKKAARDRTSPEFEHLYEECVGNNH